MKSWEALIKEFAERAIAEYHEWPGYVAILTAGFKTASQRVITDFLEAGQRLDRNITLEEIEIALESSSLAGLKKSVETCRRRQGLYHEWLRMVNDRDKERRHAHETDDCAAGASFAKN